MLTRRKFIIVVGGVTLAGLAGCGGEEEVTVACEPRPFRDDDECAVCGMYIAHYPGPKAQACLRDGRLLTFCSTSDMFVWLLQPVKWTTAKAMLISLLCAPRQHGVVN